MNKNEQLPTDRYTYVTADYAEPDFDEIAEQVRKRLQTFEQASPTDVLGSLVLMHVVGGAIAGTAVMPRTEAVVLELTSATTQAPDLIQG